MTLPASGIISMSMVNTELGLGATNLISLNDAAVRTLFGKPSGAISMSDGHGKSNTRATYSGTFTDPTFTGTLETSASSEGYGGPLVLVSGENMGLDHIWWVPGSWYNVEVVGTRAQDWFTSITINGHTNYTANMGTGGWYQTSNNPPTTTWFWPVADSPTLVELAEYPILMK